MLRWFAICATLYRMTSPANRQDAAAVGSKTYRTDRPCRNGHTADRYTSTGGCVECLRSYRNELAVTLRATQRPSADGSRMFTYRLHPDDHEAALAFCQALDLQRGRAPKAGQAVVAPEPPRSATAEEVAAHRERIFGHLNEAQPERRHLPEEMRKQLLAAGLLRE